MYCACVIFRSDCLHVDYPLKLPDQLRLQLQALRKKRGLTQAQLGQAIGVTQARVVEIEASPGVVSLQQTMQVLNALGAALVIRETDPGASKEPRGEAAEVPANKVQRKPVSRARQGRW